MVPALRVIPDHSVQVLDGVEDILRDEFCHLGHVVLVLVQLGQVPDILQPSHKDRVNRQRIGKICSFPGPFEGDNFGTRNGFHITVGRNLTSPGPALGILQPTEVRITFCLVL